MVRRYIRTAGFTPYPHSLGHNIGLDVHEQPRLTIKRDTQLKPGMVFCLEPMVAVGKGEIKKSKDGSAYETADGSLSAHFEHTMVATKNGCQILTE